MRALIDVGADGRLRLIKVDGAAPREAIRPVVVAEIAAAARSTVLANRLADREFVRQQVVALLAAGVHPDTIAARFYVSRGQIALWAEQ